MDSTLHAQYDHLRRTVDALTALGKDPRKGELSPAEITIAISRDRLPTPARIKWDEKTKADQTMAANLGQPMKLEPKLRISLRGRSGEGAKFLHAAVSSPILREDSSRIEETPELEIARPRKTKRAAAQHALLSMEKHQEELSETELALCEIRQSGTHERNTGTSAKGACKEKTAEVIEAQVNISATECD
ncbi:hypothetical protein T10_1526 [Trichinella papuae]|uniref:Uncharacterized protein n=1 Tax=Trichinella papuae TaxID=268474 RepID=A0A0V1MVZ7_9BILA|nr:hypothetical protein T10_1526 [Trichinella papuae]